MNEKMLNRNEGAVFCGETGYGEKNCQVIRSGLAPKAMEAKLLSYHENDIAEALRFLTREERERVFRVLPAKTLADIFEYSDERTEYLKELNVRRQVEVIGRMEVLCAAEILEELEKGEREPILGFLDPGIREKIRLVSSFDEEEIGSIMSANFIAIPRSSTVKEAMSRLIAEAADHDNITTLFVVDEEQVFCGAIDLRDLIIAREGESLESITRTTFPYVYARSPLEDCIVRLRDYSEDSVPVLDDENRLMGVITAKNFMEAVEDEMNEDYARLGGLSVEEELSEPVFSSVRKRLPWLVMLLGFGLFVSSVVGVFEAVVAALPIVICFQSLILDMAGNVGTQSLAVTIRVLTDEKIHMRQKLSLIFKEGQIGFFNGAILGLLSFFCIGAYLWLLQKNPLAFSFSVSGVIGISLVTAMVCSALSGTVIPLAFKRIGVDPAVASGPLITTVNDLVAVVAYYGLTWLLLIRTLG